MLSDTLFDLAQQLREDLTHYTEPPFVGVCDQPVLDRVQGVIDTMDSIRMMPGLDTPPLIGGACDICGNLLLVGEDVGGCIVDDKTHEALSLCYYCMKAKCPEMYA